MKTILLVALVLSALNAFSATTPQKTYSFQFKTIKSPIVTQGADQQIAFKMAAQKCFEKLTGGKYPGEEKGLDIIDICANPKM